MNICVECNKDFGNSRAMYRHMRKQHKLGGNVVCCIRTKQLLTLEQFRQRVWRNCLKCETEFLSKRDAVFCSQRCAAIVNNTGKIHSAQSRQKRSEAMQRNGYKQPIIQHESCRCCSNPYESTPNAIYCSQSCARQSRKIALENRKPMGGYRARAGRGHHGWYKDYWCDSSYEMAYVWHCLELGITIKRNTEKFPYFFEGKWKNYIPDFIVDDNYVEIKGWMRPSDYAKINQFPHPIEVITGTAINAIVNDAKSKLGVKDLRVLYSERPLPKGECANCGDEFLKIHSNRNSVCCSRKCGALWRRRKVGPPDGNRTR